MAWPDGSDMCQVVSLLLALTKLRSLGCALTDHTVAVATLTRNIPPEVSKQKGYPVGFLNDEASVEALQSKVCDCTLQGYEC